MFINIKTHTEVKHTPDGQELMRSVETLYLFDGQDVNENTNHPETQKYYKSLYLKQTEATIKQGRPVSIFEAFGLGGEGNPLKTTSSPKTPKPPKPLKKS